ncbi:hypothetical protein F4604DRAFT_1941667 [Suillus subluteus]|nr:hypothetical protein F4604DRAFT_1941667 [Suillus subluteus]
MRLVSYLFLTSLDATGTFGTADVDDQFILFRISCTLMSTHLFPSSLNPSALANAIQIPNGHPDTRTSITSCTGACVPLALNISVLGTLAINSLTL